MLWKKRRSLGQLVLKRKADFWAKKGPCEYLVDRYLRLETQRRRPALLPAERARFLERQQPLRDERLEVFPTAELTADEERARSG